MKSPRHILIFTGILVITAFFSKVNKIALYDGFFSKIIEIGLRNSQTVSDFTDCNLSAEAHISLLRSDKLLYANSLGTAEYSLYSGILFGILTRIHFEFKGLGYKPFLGFISGFCRAP